MKLQFTLRTRLIFLMLAAIVPLLGLSVVGVVLSAQEAVARATQNLAFSAALVAANQERVADSARQVLAAVVQSPQVQSGLPADCQPYLNSFNEQALSYANLGIVGLDGYVRCQAQGSGSDTFLGDRAYFQQALAQRSFVASGYLTSRAHGKPVIVFARPVLNRQGATTGVAFAAVFLSELSRSVVNAPLPSGSRLVVTDRQGTVLVASPENSATVGDMAPGRALQEALKAGASGVLEGLDANAMPQIYALAAAGTPAPSSFLVAVSADSGEVVGPARKRLALVLVALALVALWGSAMAWILAGRAIVKPAAAIARAIGQFRQGGRDVRVALGSVHETDEFSQIAAGFNLMAASLQSQQDALKNELLASQTAHARLLDAQRLARLGYWQIDLPTRQISWSEEVHALFPMGPALLDASYGSCLKRVHRDDRHAFAAACAQAIETGAALALEFRLVLPGGQTRWAHLFSRALALGETQRCGVVQDITERKNAELAIARSTELLNRTGALAKVGGWEFDARTLALYCSQETCRIHDLDPQRPLPGGTLQGLMAFYAAQAQPVIQAAVQAALENAAPWDLELPLVTATGRPTWVRTQGRALLENGKVVRLVGALQDIGAQYEAQQHLRLLETCISRLNDTVIITEAVPSGAAGRRILFVNDAFERQTGYRREEVLGKSPHFLQGPDTSRVEMARIRAALDKFEPVRAELVNYTKSGRAFWLEMEVGPISNEKGDFTHWVAVQRNITERKLAEQALVHSEQRYAALFNTAPVPMWVYDTATTRFLAVNDAMVGAYGYSVAQFQSMTIFDIRPPAEHERLRRWLDDPLRRTALWQQSRKDGSTFPVETVSQPIRYGERDARFVIALDKTVQEQAEKEVQAYLFTLQRSADAAQAITWHQTLEGTMQEIANQARGVVGAHQAMVSLTRDGPAASGLNALSTSEKYEPYRGLMAASGGCGIYALVCDNNRPVRMTQAELEAHPRWRGFGGRTARHPPLRGWLAVPLVGRNGKNIGMLQLSDKYEGEFTKQDEYVLLELSHLASAGLENARLLEEIGQLNAGLEQKVTERTVALARQEALFRALAEQAPQLVWTTTPDGHVNYVNRAWFELLGGALQDWTGMQWLAAVHPDDVPDVKENWKIAQASQSPYAGVRRLVAKNGSSHTMAYRCSPVFDAQGDIAFWVGIDADITEIKSIEAALRLSNQELEAFSYSVSHDLRSPLNTVDGFSRLLAKQLAPQLDTEAGAKMKHYLMRIQAGVAQMGQLIEDLLSLSQVTRAQLRCEPVDLSLAAHSLLGEWQSRHPERQVRVTIEPGLQAQADGRLVGVAMENLLSNAWKFTSQTAQARICVGQQLDAAGLPVFFVRDNGAGFSMDYADKLFNPFQRLHAASEFSGTGIGLATVSRVIKRHGGRIWAESAPACGATFFFTLPQGEAYRVDGVIDDLRT